MSDLQPPRRSTELEDPGARELDQSDEDHFSDASDGEKSQIPIPTTRVERTDDRPAHGDVPGTDAHAIRTQDAVPDEYEVIPEASDLDSRSKPTATIPIPETVIEKVDPDEPSHGDVEGTLAHDMRRADAAPDVVKRAPDVTRTDLEGEGFDDQTVSAPFESVDHPDQTTANEPAKPDADDDADDNADDDFEAFEEGGDVYDDDFGAFDEGEQELATAEQNSPAITSPPAPRLELPVPNFQNSVSLDDIVATTEPYLRELFPGLPLSTSSKVDDLSEVAQSFLSERSQSLWEQLVAPPPLQPPDWVRSRIRRLFLVSLGVPVDLDEILPASKQKKLVLPSIESDSEKRSPVGDSSRGVGAGDTTKDDAAATTGQSASASKGERRRRGPPPPPEFDANTARLMCSTTDVALKGLTDNELRQHVTTLYDLKQLAGQTLEYWLIQKDSANGDCEAFEEVIENLVKHAKKVRK